MRYLRIVLLLSFLASPGLAVAEHQLGGTPPEDMFTQLSQSIGYEDTSLRPQKVLGTFGAPELTVPAYSAHAFPKGQCTQYVASKRKITFRGNAKNWPTNATKHGYALGDEPMVGAIVVTNEGPYGHVAYVESVQDGTFTISERNYIGRGKFSIRTLPNNYRAVRTFIY